MAEFDVSALMPLEDGAVLTIKVTPKAAAARLSIDKDMFGEITIRVAVTAAPEKGKANAAVLKLMSKALGVPKSSLSIIKGETSRSKLIRYQGR